MQSEHLSQRKTDFWLQWILFNAIGLGLAWPAAELLGQFIYSKTNWYIAVSLAGILFEAILWLARGSVNRHYPELRLLRPIDFLVWIASELIGWAIGEGVRMTSDNIWITAGAVWGVMLGASIWMIIWFMRLPKPRTRWWFASVPFWTFVGMVIASVLMGGVFSIVITVNQILNRYGLMIPGWGFAGGILGIFIGVVTGFALIRFSKWMVLT